RSPEAAVGKPVEKSSDHRGPGSQSRTPLAACGGGDAPRRPREGALRRALCPDGSGTFISRGAVGVVESVVEALRKAAKEDLEPGTDVTHFHDPSQVYPSGAHLAVVEIDPVGLIPHVVRYVVIEDCGRVLDRDLVEGQVRGAVAMGIGEVLLEEHAYSEDGQLMTSALRQYLPPLAPDVPPLEIHHLESPSPNTAL